MKALQTRSPIHLFYRDANLAKVVVKIWLKENPANLDIQQSPNYELKSESINNESIFEISDLLRSANQYEFKKDFYEKRDTAIYVLCKAELIDSNDALIETRHNFLRVRDGYVKRQCHIQILNNFISSDVRNFNNNANVAYNLNKSDPFGGNNAIVAGDNDNLNQFRLRENNLGLTGTHTFLVWLKRNSNDRYRLSCSSGDRIIVDLLNKDIDSILSLNDKLIAYDLFIKGSWVLCSASFNLESTDYFELLSENVADPEDVYVFNPKITKGDQINQEAKDLILQDNFTNYTSDNINFSIPLDTKLASDDTNFNKRYYYNGFENQIIFKNNLDVQLKNRPFANSLLTFVDKNKQTTTQETKLIEFDECRYTPAKVSFINRFGVIQDLVFFKKRVDSSSTESESYKANVITSGEVYPHLGQKRVYNKQAESKVKLSSGFYPESFNTVFKQLIYSDMVWIDDEPAIITTSSFRQKTQIDDKLINYDMDFDFANDDINSIR